MDVVSSIALVKGSLDASAAEKQQQQREAAALKLEQRGIELAGRQEELDIRHRMMEAAASINTSVAASGITAGSGSADVSLREAKKAGMSDIFATKTGTKTKILESMMRGATSRASSRSRQQAGTIKAIGHGAKAIASYGERG